MSVRRLVALVVVALTSVASASACAKAPDAKASADAKPEADAGVEGRPDAGRQPVPGLPMPQQFPHVVWDAAGADAAARADSP
jgi:hypothetical protein